MTLNERIEITIRKNQAQAMELALLCERDGYGDAQEWWTLSAMYGAMADSIMVRCQLPANRW